MRIRRHINEFSKRFWVRIGKTKNVSNKKWYIALSHALSYVFFHSYVETFTLMYCNIGITVPPFF